ncbi:MAG: hypothetical protein K0R29_1178 [Pseudobdellovibrio sp.]|jgi:hypothetical protein|nr:hypothetical protein [Pseudobdellovibrio sp.]
MEQNRTVEPVTTQTKDTEAKRFSMASILKKDGRWKVLGITIEAWLFAFLVALAIPYINIIAIPVMFFVFAGALAVYTVWALFKLV